MDTYSLYKELINIFDRYKLDFGLLDNDGKHTLFVSLILSDSMLLNFSTSDKIIKYDKYTHTIYTIETQTDTFSFIVYNIGVLSFMNDKKKIIISTNLTVDDIMEKISVDMGHEWLIGNYRIAKESINIIFEFDHLCISDKNDNTYVIIIPYDVNQQSILRFKHDNNNYEDISL